MKKKILFITAIVCFVAIAGTNMLNNSNNEPISGLLSENVEALANKEAVQIPCTPNDEDECKFSITNANGTPGTMTISRHSKV